MAVRLRLMRMGKKKQPTYRVVAADSRSPRNGRFIEIIGFYEPRQHPSVVRIDNDRAVHWLRHGAQPSERVHKILRISGAWEAFRNPVPAVSASSDASSDTGGAAAAADASSDTDAAAAADDHSDTGGAAADASSDNVGMTSTEATTADSSDATLASAQASTP